jgi:MOSC domain-containing protein YiiM/GNAT superfamily N-acetyltransferase
MDGRVLQVSVSPGGVPKQPVERAWVGEYGLEGDRQRHDTVHGGPHRAVALLGIEAIERVQADGHPIYPGSVGENLTTTGIELAGLPVGTRLAIGERLVLELSGPANPCNLIGGSFRGGKSGRISILTHPADSRMYARTLVEGEVRTGDPIRVLPPVPGSAAARHLELERIDSVVRAAEVARWEAAADAGFDVRVVDDGDLAMVASPQLASPSFNRAVGHRMLPNLTDRILDFFRTHGTVGHIVAERPPFPGAVADSRLTVFGIGPERVADAPVPAGFSMREIGPDEAGRWATAFLADVPVDGPLRDAMSASTGALVGRAGWHHLVVEAGHDVVAVSSLFMRRRVARLLNATVLPVARGRGIHRAMIARRAALAAERGCQIATAGALTGGRSAANLAAMGFDSLAEEAFYPFDPAA